RWLFDQAVCTLYAFCGVLFGLCSLGSLTVLSTVCCLKVCYPAYGRCWHVLPGPHSHPSLLTEPFFYWEATSPGRATKAAFPGPCGEATLYILALLIFCYLLPCLLILVSYALILWTVWASRRALRQH
ncbi:OPN4 protein, partial [Sitta europaea]|nr:OPN4 protein [Sitta europaea]